VTEHSSSAALRYLRLTAWVVWALSLSITFVAAGWTFQHGGVPNHAPGWAVWTVRILSFPGWPVLHLLVGESLSWGALAGSPAMRDKVMLGVAFVGGLGVGIVFWVGLVPELAVRAYRAASSTSRSQRS
jgi:hypothetical protein